MTQLKITDGMIENVVYNPHQNARNWVAVVEEDKASHGGLTRAFLQKRAHGWYRVSQDVQAGRYLEFAGDRLTMTKKRKENRRYCKILEVLPQVIIVEFCTFDHVGKWSESVPESVVKGNPLAALSDVEVLQQFVALKGELSRRGLGTLPQRA